MSNFRGLRLLSTSTQFSGTRSASAYRFAQSLDVQYIILCYTVNFGLPSILDLLPRNFPCRPARLETVLPAHDGWFRKVSGSLMRVGTLQKRNFLTALCSDPVADVIRGIRLVWLRISNGSDISAPGLTWFPTSSVIFVMLSKSDCD